MTASPDQVLEEPRGPVAEHRLDRLNVVEEDNVLLGVISEADVRGDEAPLA